MYYLFESFTEASTNRLAVKVCVRTKQHRVCISDSIILNEFQL